MGLSEAGHLYKPAPRSWHWLRSKCSSTFANPACVAAEGSDVEHPLSANNPNTAMAEIARLATQCDLEFRFCIEVLQSVLIRFMCERCWTSCRQPMSGLR